ncbi:hypothetical protein Ddye_019924 [Dipteronia dyeriana]|uniref:Peptidase S59 domain-containing protein n=1 Tax=Dipteronia dyeriana TaxID=168575 RepID=A0AAD9WUW5_9ROSI|nr:hypothetical protein Ddye_019924 [Dipteronia dyeriana]
MDGDFSSCEIWREIRSSLPVLSLLDYYMEPCLKDLAAWEAADLGYSSRVPDFTVGRFGYGYVRFLGNTDVRRLDIDRIVKFNRHELVVYEDESSKPEAGQGLNKAAEVTLILRVRFLSLKEGKLDDIVKKLKESTERQGARFISFDPLNGEWKFLVDHFSRFGFNEEEDDDIVMDDATPVQNPVDMNGGEVSDVDEEIYWDPVGPELSHSLPAHLRLDPVKMQEMRMLMFQEEDEIDDFNGYLCGTNHHLVKST